MAVHSDVIFHVLKRPLGNSSLYISLQSRALPHRFDSSQIRLTECFNNLFSLSGPTGFGLGTLPKVKICKHRLIGFSALENEFSLSNRRCRRIGRGHLLCEENER